MLNAPEHNFSSGLRITVLNDFLLPEQTCTKPASLVSTINEKVLLDHESSSMIIEYDGVVPTPSPILPSTPAKITLSDCLACSGCITSSEVIFLESQSTSEFSKQLNDKSKTVVISVSQQSISSLATFYKLTPDQSFAKLRTFFMKIGINYVFSLSTMSDLSLIEVAKEFVERKKRHEQGDKLVLPMLLGYCPGWVCYAEKAGDSSILEHISTTKSSQQLMGSYLKSIFAQEQKIDPFSIYHATIGQCFDKKLEAVRDSISNPMETSLAEVDIVLSTTELVNLINEYKIDFMSLLETIVDGPHSIFTRISGGDFGSSHGFSDMTLKIASKQFWGIDVDINNITYKKGRNNEIWETELLVNGEVVLSIARAYGFRNIQNIMRAIKRNNCKYDFVELLACPGGCTNGGGQIKADISENPKELLQRVNQNYNSATMPVVDPQSNPFVIEYYSKLTQDTEQQRKLHTTYKVLQPVSSSNLLPFKILW